MCEVIYVQRINEHSSSFLQNLIQNILKFTFYMINKAGHSSRIGIPQVWKLRAPRSLVPFHVFHAAAMASEAAVPSSIALNPFIHFAAAAAAAAVSSFVYFWHSPNSGSGR